MNVVKKVMDKGEVAFGPVWKSDHALRDHVHKIALQYGEMLAKLTRQAERGMTVGQAHRRTYPVLRSFDAKLCSLILGWPNYVSPVTFEEIERMASALNPRTDCDEVIFAYAKPKKSGYRTICIFGPERRALQCLAREVLRAIWGTSPFEYASPGRGRDRAMANIIAQTKRGGARWFLIADIKDCYGSFDRNGLIEKIPLPQAIIENCLLIPDTALVIIADQQNTQTSQTAARRGIPQGSLSSSYLASKLLEPILRKMKGRVVVGFADDMCIGTKTEAETTANKQTLVELLAAHPAGPLLMKHVHVAPLGAPIDFLGYRIRRRWRRYGGGARVTPSPAAFSQFYANMREKLNEVELSALDGVAGDYMMQWCKSNGAWDRSAAGDDLVWHEVYGWILPSVRSQKMKANKLGIYGSNFKADYPSQP